MPNHIHDQQTARLAGAALARAPILAIAGFTALGSVFACPGFCTNGPATSSSSSASSRPR